jgi:hypothetical protein
MVSGRTASRIYDGGEGTAGADRTKDLTGDDYSSDPDWFHAVNDHLVFHPLP